MECSASGVAQCESGRCYGVKGCEVKCGAAHCESGSSVVLYSGRFCSVECSASGVAQCESGRRYGVK